MAKRLLVIEDQPEIRRLYVEIFSHHGYEVVEATNGEEGLRMAEAGGFTAILTDLKMPGKDGLEVLRHLKEYSTPLPNGPIIVISSVTYPFAKEEVLRRGAAGFILKDSMEPAELLEYVSQAIENHSQKLAS